MIFEETNNEINVDKYFEHVPYQQNPFFKKIQEKSGRQVKVFVARDTNRVHGYAQFVGYVFPFLGTLWYCAKGPLLNFDSVQPEEEFFKYIKENLKNSNGFIIRFEQKPKSGFLKPKKVWFRPGSFMSSKQESVVDLEKDIMSNISKNARTKINKAGRELSVEIVQTNLSGMLEEFYTLLKESSSRGGFALHSKEYYKNMLSILDQTGNAGIFVKVSLGNRPLSINLISISTDEAYFMFAGNSVDALGHNASLYAQYKAMEFSKGVGLKRYNLGGVSTNKYSKLKDLTIFKSKFGGEIETNVAYDFRVKKLKAFIYLTLQFPGILHIRKLISKIIYA